MNNEFENQNSVNDGILSTTNTDVMSVEVPTNDINTPLEAKKEEEVVVDQPVVIPDGELDIKEDNSVEALDIPNTHESLDSNSVSNDTSVQTAMSESTTSEVVEPAVLVNEPVNETVEPVVEAVESVNETVEPVNENIIAPVLTSPEEVVGDVMDNENVVSDSVQTDSIDVENNNLSNDEASSQEFVDEKKSKKGLIIGIIVGVIVLVAVAVCAYLFLG